MEPEAPTGWVVRPNSFKEGGTDADSRHLVIALTTFDGIVTLEDGQAISARLTVDDHTLRLDAGEIELGTWGREEWSIFPDGEGFSIRAGTESLSFVPDDPDEFRASMDPAIDATVATLVGAIDTPLKSVTELVEAVTPPSPPPTTPPPSPPPEKVADQIPDEDDEPNPDRRRLVAIGLGTAALLAVLAVAVVSLLSGERNTGPDSATVAVSVPTAAPSPSTTVASTPSSVVAVTSTTVAPETPSVFDLSPRGFVTTWNAVARRFRVPVELPPEYADTLGRHAFSPFLTLEVEGSDTVDLIRFIGDPAGDPVSDRIMLATLGVTISVVEPDLDAPGRAGLLAQLGLDIRDPILPGLFGTLERRGAVYTLVFDDEADVLVLEVRAS